MTPEAFVESLRAEWEAKRDPKAAVAMAASIWSPSPPMSWYRMSGTSSRTSSSTSDFGMTSNT